MFYFASENLTLQAVILYVGSGVLPLIIKCGALRKRASEAQVNAPGILGTQMNPNEEC